MNTKLCLIDAKTFDQTETDMPVQNFIGKYDSLMVDIECLSLKHYGLVYSIGIVAFNLFKDDDYLLGYDLYINPLTLMSDKRIDIDSDTVNWTYRENREEFLTACKIGVDANTAMASLYNFMTSMKPKFIWGNSPSVDCDLPKDMLNLFNFNGNDAFPFNLHMDVRTLKTLMRSLKVDYKKNRPKLKAHNAIADCLMQIHEVKLAIGIFEDGVEYEN